MEPVESLSIVNVVASASLSQELDLSALAGDLETAEYRPDNLPGIVYRTEDPATAALIFRTGKITITGAESIGDTERVAEQLFDTFRSLGLAVPNDPDVTIQNMVFTGNLGYSLNLPAIAVGLGLENLEYEPEEFPGLVYRPPGIAAVSLLFGSGKVVIVGGTQREDAERAIEQVYYRLNEENLLG